MLWVTDGEGTLKANGKTYELRRGYVFFVGADAEVEMERKSGLQLWRAFAE